MEIRVPHALESAELAARLAAAAQLHDVELIAAADGKSGTVTKNAGLLGAVRAQYSIEAAELVVLVTDRPSFVPEPSLRRVIEDELAQLVAR
jgi:hypothetical protein